MSYAETKDNLDIELQTGLVAQDISDNDISLSTTGGDGVTLISPANGEVNVAVTTQFEWDSTTAYGGYKLVFADNQELTNPTEYYITTKTLTVPVDLSGATTYYWKVVGGDVVDNPVEVPDDGFTGMTVWDAQTDPAPIYVYDQAAPRTVEAANDLADYIAESSGKTRPDPTPVSDSFSFPSRCIKVGFPETFTEREETLIKCVDGGPIELTGVDEYDPQNPDYNPDDEPGEETDTDYMLQAGTYHAVMTFLQDYVGVVWGWIGDIGEAVPTNTELKVPVVNTKRAPTCPVRNVLGFSEKGNASPYGIGKTWLKRQRAFWSTLVPRGHAFTEYYDRFHPDAGGDNIDIFALQPDNSRGTFPVDNQGNVVPEWVKMEVGESSLVDVWNDVNVVEGLAKIPQKEVINCAFNDASISGHSVDVRAKTLDYPTRGRATSGTTTTLVDTRRTLVENPFTNDIVGETIEFTEGTNTGETVVVDSLISGQEISFTSSLPNPVDNTSFYQVQDTFTSATILYASGSQTVPAITDREIAFTKKCLAKLRETNSEVDVVTQAYGPSRPAPRREQAVDGIFISNIANDFSSPNPDSGYGGKTHRQNMDEWLSAWGQNIVWRPNLSSAYGHNRGMWYNHVDLGLGRLKDIIPLGCVGLTPDNFWEHYSTQWPMYYAATQLVWDNSKTIDEILDPAYNTLFGDAAPHIKAYYESTESVIENNIQGSTDISDIPTLWNNSRIAILEGHISSALGAVDPASDEYLRVEWVQTGLEWCKDVVRACEYWIEYNAPAVVTDETNLADNANAIETDVDGNAGWTGRVRAAPTSQSDVTNGSNFAFIMNANDNIHTIATREDLPGTASDFYLVSIDLKHSGTGTRASVTLNGVAKGDVYPDNTDWQTFQFGANGGDTIEIRVYEDFDAIFYVDNLIIQAAEPVDQAAVATEWNAHNDSARSKLGELVNGNFVFIDKWKPSPPIGQSVLRETGRLPAPNSTESGPTDPGLE